MASGKSSPGKPPIFSAKRIAALTQLFKDKLAEVTRLQRLGKLPFYKKIPKSVVYTADIRAIVGRSERTAQRIMALVRAHAGKTRGQYITVEDFQKATGVDALIVQRVLDMCT